MAGMALLVFAVIIGFSAGLVGYGLARIVAKAARRKRTWVFSHLKERDG